MKQADRQLLRVAAIALVEAHDVQAATKRFGGKPAHVVRVARSVESVQRDERRVRPRARVPMAVRGDARMGVDVEVPTCRRGKTGEMPRVAPAVERHFVTARERGPWQEGAVHYPSSAVGP